MSTTQVTHVSGRIIEDPPFAKFIFNDTRFAWFWAIVRVLLGISWLEAGLSKFGNPAWMESGVALRGFWENAVRISETGRPVIAFDWYRSFIQGLLDANVYTWFAPLIVISQIAVGIALIAGAFVGIAAFGGAFMNWNFVMAGAASSNALLGLAALLLILAWKTAGWWGLDRFLLPRVGVPWMWLEEAKRPHEPRAMASEVE